MPRRFILAFVITVSLLLVLPHLNAGSQVREAIIPSSIQSCLPPTPPHLPGSYQFDLVGKVESPHGRYQKFYLLDVHRPWEESDFPWTTLIGTDTSGQCFNFLGQDAAYVTLTAYMPKDLAKAIAFQRFSHWLTVHPDQGVERIEAMLRSESFSEDVPTSVEMTTIAPEDAWALHALGYEIPADVFILPELTPS